MEFILRFTLSHPGLSTTIVGTAKPGHLAGNIATAEKGPLPADLYAEARKRLAPVPGITAYARSRTTATPRRASRPAGCRASGCHCDVQTTSPGSSSGSPPNREPTAARLRR